MKYWHRQVMVTYIDNWRIICVASHICMYVSTTVIFTVWTIYCCRIFGATCSFVKTKKKITYKDKNTTLRETKKINKITVIQIVCAACEICIYVYTAYSVYIDIKQIISRSHHLSILIYLHVTSVCCYNIVKWQFNVVLYIRSPPQRFSVFKVLVLTSRVPIYIYMCVCMYVNVWHQCFETAPFPSHCAVIIMFNTHVCVCVQVEKSQYAVASPESRIMTNRSRALKNEQVDFHGRGMSI